MNCKPFLLCGTGLCREVSFHPLPREKNIFWRKYILTIVQGYHRIRKYGKWGHGELSPPSFEGILFILYNLKMSLHIMNLKLQPYQLFRIVLTPHLIIWINNFLPWINVATNCGCTSFFFWLKHSTKTIMYQLCLCLHFQSSNYTAFSRSSVSEV